MTDLAGIGVDDGEAGQVDRYLDEMFDRLAGTGEAGRRALTETEDHLRAAVADGLADGLSRAAAERRAVARFGPSAGIAAQLRRTQRRGLVRSTLSGAWALAGLALLLVSGAYLISATGMAVLLRTRPEELPPCPPPRSSGYAVECGADVSIMRMTALAGLGLLLLGLVVLGGRRLVIRSGVLAPVGRGFPQPAAVLLALAGVLVHLNLLAPAGSDGVLGFQRGPGLPVSVIAGLVMVAAAVAVAVWGVVRAHRAPVRLRATGPAVASGRV